MDPLLERQARNPAGEYRAISGFNLDFAGQGFTGVNPTDPVGDVGPEHYIQMINGSGGAQFTIYNKTDGSVALGPVVLDGLAPGGNCASGAGDPIVLYDELAERWILTEFSGAGNTLCFYITPTSNPLVAPWTLYAASTPNFPDYPKYGVWPDAYYISTNESGGPAVYALGRSAILAGAVTNLVRRTAPALAGFGFQALTPSDLDGATPPRGGTPNFFMRHRDDEVHALSTPVGGADFLEIWEFSYDSASPGSSTFALAQSITVSEFDSNLCGLVSFSCFPQPGSAVQLDPLREVVMSRLAYRNLGSHESMVGNFVTDVSGADLGGIRWFELRRSPAGAGTWTLYQEGTYSIDSVNRWMGSIAMDQRGNFAVAYNVTSTTEFPGIRLTGRWVTDPLGTMKGESTLVTGTAANVSNRYGDYSSLTVDPTDGCTLWYTNQYNAASTWSTRILTVKAPFCADPMRIFVGDEEEAEPADKRR